MIMTAAIGFLMIIAIVALLLKGKMSPIVVLAVIPVIAALILGFSPVEIMDFIADGIKTTTSNGILFIFSVIYFGVLADTGLFDVIVGWLVKKAGNNVIAVTVVTALIATIAHLDGTTAVTVLITIPAMYLPYISDSSFANSIRCVLLGSICSQTPSLGSTRPISPTPIATGFWSYQPTVRI